MLRQRALGHGDAHPFIQAMALLIVIVFLIYQSSLLALWLKGDPLKYALGMGALAISAIVLYGRLFMSFFARILVNLLLPSGEDTHHGPDYNAAEACERKGDYSGAAREYLLAIRMFPKEPLARLHAAEMLLKLGRPQEAAERFEETLARMNDPAHSLRVAYRLVELYTRELGHPELAILVLREYVRRFPEAERIPSVRARLAQLENLAHED